MLYRLAESEGLFKSPEELLGWQAEIMPTNYSRQTPVMFARRWSPIAAVLQKGFEPITLKRNTTSGPTGVAAGIWLPGVTETTKPVADCETDEDLFWAIMNKVFKRARERSCLVSIIAQ